MKLVADIDDWQNEDPLAARPLEFRHPPRSRPRNLTSSSRPNYIFTCPNEGCYRSFYWKGSLTWHVKNACGQQPRFKCPYCDYCCKVKGDIRKHINRVHKGSEVYVIELVEHNRYEEQ